MEQTHLLYKGRCIPFSCVIDVAWSLEPGQELEWRRIFGVVRWNLNVLFVMAQVLLGVFSWKFRALTSLIDELNSSENCISQGRKVKGGFCCVWVFVFWRGFVGGFVFFFWLLQARVFILQEKDVDCKDLLYPGYHGLCFGELLCLMESSSSRMPSESWLDVKASPLEWSLCKASESKVSCRKRCCSGVCECRGTCSQ